MLVVAAHNVSGMAVLRSNQLTIGRLVPPATKPRAGTWSSALWEVPASHRAIVREIVVWTYYAIETSAFFTVRVWTPEQLDVQLFAPAHITSTWLYRLTCNTVLRPGDKLAYAGNSDDFRWLISGALLPIP